MLPRQLLAWGLLWTIFITIVPIQPGVPLHLKKGVSTGMDGTYRIANIPREKFLVEVKYIGYSSTVAVTDALARKSGAALFSYDGKHAAEEKC